MSSASMPKSLKYIFVTALVLSAPLVMGFTLVGPLFADHLKHIPGFLGIMLDRKEMIRLPGGSPANLIEARMKNTNQMPWIGVGVIAYHRGKLIGVIATAIRGPIARDQLKSMVMSLTLE